MILNRRVLAGAVIGAIVCPWLMTAPALAADAKSVAKAAPPKMAGARPAAAPKATAPAPVIPDVPKLSAEQIVDKHIAARGGAQAWKAVAALQFSGKLEAGKGSTDALATKTTLAGKRLPVREGAVSAALPAGAPLEDAKQVLLPFTIDMKRPNKTRIEVEFAGKTAVQVYDGAHGWKLRPFLNRNDAEPFTADEAKSEASRAEPEGLLVDYAAKGTTFALDGVDLVDGKPAYRLKVTKRGAKPLRVWIDAKTFLDVKVEGAPHRMDGKMHDVFVTQRDFRPVQGVMVPFQLETQVDGYPDTHKMLIEKAALNPRLDDALFAKPHA